MKKLFIASALVAVVSLAQATTINLPSAMLSSTSGNLEGNYAYAWGIDIGSGNTLTSFTLNFNNTKLTASGNAQGTGILYADLLNTTTINQSSPFYTVNKTEGDAGGDYWQTAAAKTAYGVTAVTALGSQSFASLNTSHTWSYTPDLAVLNSYSGTNGIISIGLDPDCYFSPGTISVTYTVSSTPHTVPDGAVTAFLLGIGLVGIEMFRRQSMSAKNKA